MEQKTLSEFQINQLFYVYQRPHSIIRFIKHILQTRFVF
jgi:hypothetical protein